MIFDGAARWCGGALRGDAKISVVMRGVVHYDGDARCCAL